MAELKDARNLLNFGIRQLVIETLQVVELGSPKIEFKTWPRVQSFVQRCSGSTLDDILDLVRPFND